MRKIAIVAKAGTASLAPWHDTGWDIWGMPWISYPRIDRLFDMHDELFYNNESKDEWKNQSWVENIKDAPVYAEESRSHLPNYIKYPLEAVKESIPIHYFENSISYMIALAIYEEVDEIGLWGVHLRGIREYEAERPSVTYLIGLAQGRGIKVFIQPGTPLLASKWEAGRYGVNNKKRLQNPCYSQPIKQS